MFMPMEKPKDKSVDRSYEVAGGMRERVVKPRIVCHMPAGQRGDARDAKSTRGVLWQPNPAEAAEGELLGMAMARIDSVPMVPIDHRPAVPVVEPREPSVSTPGEKWSS